MKEINVFELKHDCVEIKFPSFRCDIDEYLEGLTASALFDQVDSDPEVVGAFNTLEEARAALKKCGNSSIKTLSNHGLSYFFIDGYWIEENVYEIDENGDREFLECGGCWDCSEFEDGEEIYIGQKYIWNAKNEHWDEVEEACDSEVRNVNPEQRKDASAETITLAEYIELCSPSTSHWINDDGIDMIYVEILHGVINEFGSHIVERADNVNSRRLSIVRRRLGLI